MADLTTQLLNQSTHSERQYLRECKLLVSDNKQNALDLSQLRIKFSVKRSDTMTPNAADIRVYNVEKQTALYLYTQLNPSRGKDGLLINKGKVTLQAGYTSNFGVIFQGNIKQILIGRESATDTYVDIIAGDGDSAYNFAVVNTTLAAGSTQNDQVKASAASMAPHGVTEGHIGIMPINQLPRGKVMYGNARNYLRDVATTTQKTWSIQDGKITFVPITSYLPGERVILNSKTGLIGSPQQTNTGVNVKCLINPLIRVGGLIDIDEASVEEFKLNLNVPGSPSNNPSPLTADGSYYVMVIEYSGDTRGVDWYCTMVCMFEKPSANPLNSVQAG